ncbi:valine tRNA-ligase [Tupanvirus deep ocean]|uniref:Valine tRNA-ligase n=2 Tax=Tupanvirus TaxID=2094720 RepID=A0AC62A6V1_9VIRU|nr:valine tRNA-ligase [Tupanvirus deep ocean]QKU33515.1 valine tRNA-ligase [Tupanvirus deep ocean]
MAQYDIKSVEKKWQKYWFDNDIYRWDQDQPKENTFVVDTPPPTVSGTLHMGHIFSYTQTDFITRFQRMKGKTVYYPMGFDDNGLPTERLVEKTKNIKAHDMTREDFIDICENVVLMEETKFRELFKSIGLSVDWKEEYHTISNFSMKISQMSFLDLFNKNRVYRQMEPTYWDTVDGTALAKADLEDIEMPATMNEIIFTTTSGEKIIIATTRPELIPAAVAVFYHPTDERYQHLHGQNAIVPLFGTIVPIIADDGVKMDKGTGLVMCSTFGDQTDIMWWRKHKLPLRVIISKNGKICNLDRMGSDDWPSVNSSEAEINANKIRDLDVVTARKRVISMLNNEKLLLKQTAIKHTVKCAERSKAPIEILVTLQWFIKLLDQKEQLQEKANQCNWHPPHMKHKIDQWINGLDWDWCISRQRYFGIPFPIWYSKREGEEGKILLPKLGDLPVDPLVDLPAGYLREEVDAETDVMDTWATSSVTPQLNSRAINNENAVDLARHQKLFPADLRPQAHEIIRTWAFYTIAKAHLHQNSVPWHNLMISGWCLAPDGDKMAKSKGNIISPVELIDKYGADVVRYWASTAKLGTDIAYSEKIMALGKRLVTKLWNASKFVSTHINLVKDSKQSLDELIANKTIYEAMDLWILAKLQTTIKMVTSEFNNFEYHDARLLTEKFFWHDFCDNYLEIVKNRAYDAANKNPKGKLSAAYTLYHCLKTIIKLFAPYLPFITEELYQMYFINDEKSVHCCGTWPNMNGLHIDYYYSNLGNAGISILNTVRKMKANKKLSQKTIIKQLIINYGQNEIAQWTVSKGTAPIEKLVEFDDLAHIIPDLASVVNAENVILNAGTSDDKLLTDCGSYIVYFVF